MTTTAVHRDRVVHVEHCMGTVFTIDIRDAGIWSDAINDVISWLHQVDEIFSTYRPDSDISRIRRGELAVAEADPLVNEVVEGCIRAQRDTDGFFSPLPHGALDPTGYVKGWSVELSSRILRNHGSANHAVNGGGDIQLAGEAATDKPWIIGVADPHDRSRVIATVSGRDLAIATSGNAERGAHIINPFTGAPAIGLASATVIGPSLTAADAYATAVFARGQAGLAWIETVAGFEALLVKPDASRVSSAGWSELAASSRDQ